MKYLDNLLVACAFTLCTTTLGLLLASFAAWSFGELGVREQDIIAAAVQPASVDVVRVMHPVPDASTQREVKIVQFEPITVIGHRHPAGGMQLAETPFAALN